MAERLDDLRASWRRALKVGKAPRTIELYDQSVRFFARWLADQGRPETLDELTRAAIVNWLGDLSDAGQSANTVKTRFRGMRRFCRWLVAEEIIDRSPMEGLEQPQATAKPVPILTDAEIVKLLKASGGKSFEDRRDHAILRVLFDCGLRISECARITLDDWDKDAEVFVVHGKGRKIRVAPYGAKTGTVLDRYERMRRQHRYADSPALWLTQRGAMSVDGLDERLRVRARQAGVKDLHAHRFRHTTAHDWLANGGAEQDLKRLMGWTSDAMLAIYGASAADERARAAHRKLARGDRL